MTQKPTYPTVVEVGCVPLRELCDLASESLRRWDEQFTSTAETICIASTLCRTAGRNEAIELLRWQLEVLVRAAERHLRDAGATMLAARLALENQT